MLKESTERQPHPPDTRKERPTHQKAQTSAFPAARAQGQYPKQPAGIVRLAAQPTPAHPQRSDKQAEGGSG